MGNAKIINIAKGYCVIALGDVKKDWKKVVLVNRLLRMGWDVYRNTVSSGHYTAGSFFIPLSRPSIRTYLEEQARDLGIFPVFYEGELPAGRLVKLVRPRIAVLFATGEKWALMTMNVLETLGFDVNALSSENVRQCALNHANILFIPGGSPADKVSDLGPEGEAKVKEFINKGGGVLGFCGGAALLAKIRDGWGILAVERESGKKPAMHGPIWIKPEKSDHPLWYGYSSQGFPLAPWYGRSLNLLSDEVSILGRYGPPTDDFYIDHDLTGSFFSKYLPEEVETLNKVHNGVADPATLEGKVAIVEGEYGNGRIIVGYPHPETPGLEGGFLLLANAIFYVTQNHPVSDCRWLPAAGSASSFNEKEVLSALEKLKESHSSLVVPIAKDLVKFGINNLYWTPRPHIPWSYIGKSGSFYICERLEAYSDELLRQLGDLSILINEINAKRERLAIRATKEAKDGLGQVTERLNGAYRLAGQALNDTLETYHSRMASGLIDWGTHFKKILLYEQLLRIMKANNAEKSLIEEVSKRHRELNREYIGSWQLTLASEKYRDIFITLDTASYYLSNLKFEMMDSSLQIDKLLLVTGVELGDDNPDRNRKCACQSVFGKRTSRLEKEQ